MDRMLDYQSKIFVVSVNHQLLYLRFLFFLMAKDHLKLKFRQNANTIPIHFDNTNSEITTQNIIL